MGFGVLVLGFGVEGLGSKVWGFGFGASGTSMIGEMSIGPSNCRGGHAPVRARAERVCARERRCVSESERVCSRETGVGGGGHLKGLEQRRGLEGTHRVRRPTLRTTIRLVFDHFRSGIQLVFD